MAAMPSQWRNRVFIILLLSSAVGALAASSTRAAPHGDWKMRKTNKIHNRSGHRSSIDSVMAWADRDVGVRAFRAGAK
jgi:hypothetical protein